MNAIQMSRIGLSTAALLGIAILSGCATQQSLNPKISAVEQNIGIARDKASLVAVAVRPFSMSSRKRVVD